MMSRNTGSAGQDPDVVAPFSPARRNFSGAHSLPGRRIHVLFEVQLSRTELVILALSKRAALEKGIFMLEVRNIVKRFHGGVVAVDHLSFNAPDGAITGILGPNGAGKTTTIRMILNILQPDEGEILLDNRPIDDWIKNLVGYLPEERGLYQKSTIRDILHYFGELKGKTRSEVDAAIQYWTERLQFQYPLTMKIEELSKGNQQKVQFMAAIIGDPQVIILDEPFTGLDPLNQLLLNDIIAELKSNQKVVILCTHLLDAAERLCDRIVLINRGKQLLQGSLGAIKEQFGSTFVTVEFQGDATILQQCPYAHVTQSAPNRAELELRSTDDFPALLKWLADHLDVRKIERQTPSLLSIFLKVVQENEIPAEFLQQQEQSYGHP